MKEGPALVVDAYTFVAAVKVKMRKVLCRWFNDKGIYLEA